ETTIATASANPTTYPCAHDISMASFKVSLDVRGDASMAVRNSPQLLAPAPTWILSDDCAYAVVAAVRTQKQISTRVIEGSLRGGTVKGAMGRVASSDQGRGERCRGGSHGPSRWRVVSHEG